MHIIRMLFDVMVVNDSCSLLVCAHLFRMLLYVMVVNDDCSLLVCAHLFRMPLYVMVVMMVVVYVCVHIYSQCSFM